MAMNNGLLLAGPPKQNPQTLQIGEVPMRQNIPWNESSTYSIFRTAENSSSNFFPTSLVIYYTCTFFTEGLSCCMYVLLMLLKIHGNIYWLFIWENMYIHTAHSLGGVERTAKRMNKSKNMFWYEHGRKHRSMVTQREHTATSAKAKYVNNCTWCPWLDLGWDKTLAN